MNKKELLDLAGKGYIHFDETSIKVEIDYIDVFEDDIITVTVKNINPYTTPANFGGGLVKYVTDSDCDELEDAIRDHIKKMHDIEKRANMQPLRFKRIGERLLKNLENRRMYGYEECVEGHFSVYTLDSFDKLAQTGEYFCDVCRAVDIDGKVYKPVYSFWLGRTVFMFDSPEGYMKGESHE